MDKSTFIVCFQLVNTLRSKKFTKSLTDTWPGAVKSDAVFANQQIAMRDVQRAISQCERYYSFDMVYEHLNALADLYGVKLTKKDRSGTRDSITIEEFVAIQQQMLYAKHNQQPIFGSKSNARFAANELVWAAIDYFLFKDTVLNGSGFPKLDKIIQDLLSSKPAEFFKNGFPKDLFVCDRVSLHMNGNVSHISCRKDYLSSLIHDCEPNLDSKAFMVFKMAS
jgi:hypothetical protein